jgi:hypothetical protein
MTNTIRIILLSIALLITTQAQATTLNNELMNFGDENLYLITNLDILSVIFSDILFSSILAILFVFLTIFIFKKHFIKMFIQQIDIKKINKNNVVINVSQFDIEKTIPFKTSKNKV